MCGLGPLRLIYFPRARFQLVALVDFSSPILNVFFVSFCYCGIVLIVVFAPCFPSFPAISPYVSKYILSPPLLRMRPSTLSYFGIESVFSSTCFRVAYVHMLFLSVPVCPRSDRLSLPYIFLHLRGLFFGSCTFFFSARLLTLKTLSTLPLQDLPPRFILFISVPPHSLSC